MNKIFDCFMYNNEDLILEIRLNTLQKFVDKFIIVEAKQNHQGGHKIKYNLNLEKFKKFKNKIEYLQIKNFPNNYDNWNRENFQRNFILNGLNNKIIYEITHFIPQVDYLCDFKNNILVDFVGRFEKLDNDIKVLSKKLNMKINLEHLNFNVKKKLSISIYSKNDRNCCRSLF